MDPIKKRLGSQCPYWSRNRSKECGMIKGGLYIPMSEHVEMFCNSAKFGLCHQYIRGCELINESAKKYGYITDGGRRRFRRVADRLPLRVALCDEDGKKRKILDDQAVTLDLSLGGLRFESNTRIDKDTIVAFEFGGNFPIHDSAGVGEIKWCAPSGRQNRFEAGMAFADFSMTQAVGAHLGLPMI